MFMRSERLLTELPQPRRQNPAAGKALQELLGGKYGEMSTLNNYMFQSFNFRSKAKLRSIYSVVASITAEELGHVELATTGVSMLNNGPGGNEEHGGDISGAPYEAIADMAAAHEFIANGGGGFPANAEGIPWNGSFVTNTGNIIMDMLFNFHLECGARLHKLRVYETMTEEVGREVCAYLLVRGSVHAHAYALVLKKLTGVAIEKMLPVPNIPLDNIPECRKYLAEGKHRTLYTNSPSDYAEMAAIWGNGEMALPGDPPGELVVVEGPPEGSAMPDNPGNATAFVPEYAPEEMFEIATKLYQASR